MSDPAPISGTIRGYDPVLRYGWVVGADQQHYFLHRTEFTGPAPRAGEQVWFTPQQTPKGLRAAAVERVSPRVPRGGAEPATAADGGGHRKVKPARQVRNLPSGSELP